jgi:F-type H+-transporting ATPase subunit a
MLAARGLQDKHPDEHASGGMELPPSFFGEIYTRHVKGTEFSKTMGFDRFDTLKPHLGQFQFEGLCYSVIVVTSLCLLAIVGAKTYQKVPRGLQNFLEMCVEGLRGLFRMLAGKDADRHLPFLGTLFIFIFSMNLIGIVPFFRSPTMVLSITLALGFVTFLYVQTQGIKAHGFFGYLKHMMGPLIFLAPLMFPLELLGEFIKPISLSLRLYGNISGEDTLIEIFLNMGKNMYIPLHAPMLAFAVFTSFLQAFIFTGLTTIYIQLVSSHGDDHAEAHAEAGHH